MRYNAFITAGGLITGEFARIAGTTIKALIKIDGRSILERTIEALKSCESIGTVTLIAPAEVQSLPDACHADTFIEAHASGVENILRGLEHHRNDERVVLCTSDLPFIHAHAIGEFLVRCPGDAQLCYPIFERGEIGPAMRPGVPSYIKLKDGHFTGGSLFLLHVGMSLARIHEIGKSFNARKSAVAMAMRLGPVMVIKFLLGLCTSEDLLERAGQIMGGRCAGIRGCDPVITIDIDDEAAYHFACRFAEGERKR